MNYEQKRDEIKSQVAAVKAEIAAVTAEFEALEPNQFNMRIALREELAELDVRWSKLNQQLMDLARDHIGKPDGD